MNGTAEKLSALFPIRKKKSRCHVKQETESFSIDADKAALQTHYDSAPGTPGRLSESEYRAVVQRLFQYQRENGVDLAATPVPGWPRPYLEFEKDGSMKPFPWLTGEELKYGVWAGFDNRAVCAMYFENFQLCNVCGERLGEDKLFCLIGDPAKRHSSSGPMHPRCTLISLKHCPHFAELDPDQVLAHYRGDGCGMILPEGYWQDFEQGEAMLLGDFEIAPEAERITLQQLKELAQKEQSQQSSCSAATKR